jgi:cytosine/adenosine deaminase-related metal-dependent hydrolase
MKQFSAQYIYTGCGNPLKRGIISTADDGTILKIEDCEGSLEERHSVEFYNGIIVPGFVNCHCHLELSYLKDVIPAGKGLAAFLRDVSLLRNSVVKDTDKAIREADSCLYKEGIVLCADICNTTSTFPLKTGSRIQYLSLLEVFGIDASRAETRIDEVIELSKVAAEAGLPAWIVPHSVYSVSLPLFRLIKERSSSNPVTSIHFMESPDEELLLAAHSGSLMDSYRQFLPPFSHLDLAGSHAEAVVKEITSSGNLILVHNTFVKLEHIRELRKRDNLYWCLCPNSNLQIEQKMPPADLLNEEGCNIVIGTDSLSSNSALSIVEELKTIQRYFPQISLDTLIKWATINGAAALCEDSLMGTIEPGKRPGLLLLMNTDLLNLKLLPGTSVRRLI